MKKQTLDLQTLTMISLFAALIFLSIQFFKIPVGAQFIHFWECAGGSGLSDFWQ